MRSDETLEPIDEEILSLQRSLTEWECITARLIEQLQADVASNRSANWRPHFEQITRVLLRHRDLCRSELRRLGQWREDGRKPTELHESIWEQTSQLANWLERMVAP